MIAFQNVTARHPDSERPVLQDFNLALEKGSLTVLLGGSGSGKSTVCALLVGDLQPEVGSILVNGVDMTSARERDRAEHRKMLGMVSSSMPLLDDRNIGENIALPLELNGVSPKRREIRLRDVLDRFELTALASARPQSLSMGERQRAAIGRAVIAEPYLLIADEPTAHLDVVASQDIANALIREERRGMTVLITTSDEAFASCFPDGRILRLERIQGHRELP
ncbi:MAG: ATP-binding cassette domain-containing protein [Bacteroidota bacterium]|nr:ATP-binding cassette domain-containing protein [Bacteroidota bacterium]MDP4234485.1 ATP-binding cassette domain-containing protein [Bacteroidota bacterium]MDP4243866.1 ATP-binding cassette domain-containing protein [Bacteroidota bacterium]MDP4288808.1 ATP-binding cassette domain-containing protein [Bacteroidota bacterium]